MKIYTTIIFFILSNFLMSQNTEMLNDLSLNKFNKDYTSYDQLTSIYSSQVSEIAYWKSSKIKKLEQSLKELYPDDNYNLKLISHKDRKSHTQVLLYGNKQFLMIAFRGTEPSRIKDWITDAKFWNYKNHPTSNHHLANMPAGHGGFRRSLISLIAKKKLFKEIDKFILMSNSNIERSKFPIYLTGHSLGAAISQLFIEPLNYKGYNFSGAYHFAPPLAVSCKLNEYMKTNYGNKVYDIVNYKDYVPRAGRNGVAHFGKFYRICKNGLIYSEKESYIKFRFFEYFSEIKLHSLKSHIKALKNSKNSFDSISKRSTGNDYPCLRPKNESNKCK